MAAPNAFAYRLHERHTHGCAAVELEGVPQIPKTAVEWMQQYGECGLTRDLERLCDEAIEAACWVLRNRHLRGAAVAAYREEE